MLQPAAPAVARAHGRVDGDEVRVHFAEKGAVGEDEAEVGFEAFDEAAGLQFEDFAGDAAAVFGFWEAGCMSALPLRSVYERRRKRGGRE